MSVFYINQDRDRAVVYRSVDGTFDVVTVVGGTREQDWPVIANRDWFEHAKGVADRKELP